MTILSAKSRWRWIAHGRISDPEWQKGSGNTVWDDSVAQCSSPRPGFDRPPPTNFPARVTIRFDVQSEATEPILQ